MIRSLWLIFAQSVTVALGAALAFSAVTGWRPASSDEPLRAVPSVPDLSGAVAKAAPAVVTIFARHDIPGRQAVQVGTNWNSLPELNLNALGSGVIVSADGYVLTNFHVVASVTGLYVGLSDGRQVEAVLVGSDPDTDLALLRVRERGLPAIVIGQSETLRIGQAVLAIGNPFDVGQTVTSGIVSALGRHGLGLNSYEDFIQTDAAINQGNSGGALINADGELIGINTAIFSPEQSDGFVGIGFAIPSALINRVLPSLMEGKVVERGYFGFIPRQLSQEFAQDLGLSVSRGVMVSHVLPKSPAAAGDLRAFDVILSIKGEEIRHVNRMLQLIAALKPGEPVAVKVLRGKETLNLTVTPSTRPKNALERESGLPPAIESLDDAPMPDRHR